jgi:alpha-D-xyloside xylohydrolase
LLKILGIFFHYNEINKKSEVIILKFTNGQWLVKEGIKNIHPVEVNNVKIKNNELTVFASTRHIQDRSGTVNAPVLTVQLSSPMEDVISVKLTHFKGVRDTGPSFELYKNPDTKTHIENRGDHVCFTSGALTAKIDKRPQKWALQFIADNRILTESSFRNMGYIIEQNSSCTYVHEQLLLSVGECVYGLGERFTPFVKNGQVVDIWNQDGGTNSEQAYKNIPFYMTNRGYGVFVNSTDKVSFEVASEKVSRIQFSVQGEELEYMLIYGPTPKEIIRKYTHLTGKPALPPAWSFGLWLTTSFTTSYDEQTVNQFIDGMAERGIPLHVFHFDCFWMKEYQWNERVFPEPEEMLKRLKDKGLKICLWINPYIAQNSCLFDEGMKNGYLLKKANGDIWQTDLWQAGMGIVDFTNPAACEWYKDQLRALIDMGVDCFKTDFGERIPTDVVYYNGAHPVKMHNYYTYLYNKAVFEVLEEKMGKNNAVVFARSATAGSQQFPVHWGGDCWATYESMAETLRGGLSLAMSGFGFWSHDIGGFEKTATPDLYKRWCAFGLLSSHSRLHGSQSYRVPWLFDEESVDVLRFFTKLKCTLMPYIYQKACEAHKEGVPVLRPMQMEFPFDPACDYLDRQYMLGDSLLVAPVFSASGEVDYYLPEGKWLNFITGEIKEGGKWVREKHGFMSLPLMVKENSVIATGSNDSRTDYNYAENITFNLFEISDGTKIETNIYDTKGEIALTASTGREHDTVTIAINKSNIPWQVRLLAINTVQKVIGGRVQENGGFIIITAESDKISITV